MPHGDSVSGALGPTKSAAAPATRGRLAGRSPLRLATFLLPTHREVVAAVNRITALSPPPGPPAPVRMLRVCIPRRRESQIILPPAEIFTTTDLMLLCTFEHQQILRRKKSFTIDR
jgi:hypothetical protein